MPHGGLVTPFQILVLNIVVDQREIVDQFKGGRRWQGLGLIVRKGSAGKEAKSGAESFALGD